MLLTFNLLKATYDFHLSSIAAFRNLFIFIA